MTSVSIHRHQCPSTDTSVHLQTPVPIYKRTIIDKMEKVAIEKSMSMDASVKSSLTQRFRSVWSVFAMFFGLLAVAPV